MFIVFLTLSMSLTPASASVQELKKEIPPGYEQLKSFKTLFRGDNCGESSSYRIVGGHKAELGQYPWMARIGYTSDSVSVDSYSCGGAIISDLFVLTAAHCGPKHAGAWVQVRVGEYDATTESDCAGNLCAPPHQDIDIKSFYCHKHFENETMHHDICLIMLASPIQFNGFVQPICLPFYSFFLGKQVMQLNTEVSGWGLTDTAIEESSQVLLALTIPIVNRRKCSKLYTDIRYPKVIKGQICAGGIAGKDSCRGDSGGPLMAPFSVEGPPRYYLVGLVSFGEKNCSGTLPAVYTFVPRYIKWILKAADKLMTESR